MGGKQHAALKTATELDIEIGVFTVRDGASREDRVKLEQMRYLAATDMQVKGPQTSSVYSARILRFHAAGSCHRLPCTK